MPATSVRPFTTSQAVVTRRIVFRKEMRDGKPVYIREPYLLVSYLRSGSPYEKTYYQPVPNVTATPNGNDSVQLRGNDEKTTTAREESYDEIIILDAKDPFAPCHGGF